MVEEIIFLRLQLRQAHRKCSIVYQTLSRLDERFQEEKRRTETLTENLRVEKEKNEILTREKVRLVEKLNRQENEDWKRILLDEQENFIRRNVSQRKRSI